MLVLFLFYFFGRLEGSSDMYDETDFLKRNEKISISKKQNQLYMQSVLATS